jgi:hypothetical protein
MKLDSFKISLLSSQEGADDFNFTRVDARIGDLLISDPEQYTTIGSLRFASGDLVNNIEKQLELDGNIRNSLFYLNTNELFVHIHQMIYGIFDEDEEETIDKTIDLNNERADCFRGIPDGPEPFLSPDCGFLLIDKTGEFGRFLFGEKKRPNRRAYNFD